MLSALPSRETIGIHNCQCTLFIKEQHLYSVYVIILNVIAANNHVNA